MNVLVFWTMVQVCYSYVAFCTCDDVHITCETDY